MIQPNHLRHRGPAGRGVLPKCGLPLTRSGGEERREREEAQVKESPESRISPGSRPAGDGSGS
jgi:hypothetical protein